MKNEGNRFDADYWTQRYENGDFPWDLGKPSAPLQHVIKELEKTAGPAMKQWRILIPGAGNAWEALWLQNRGYENVFILDISPKVIAGFQEKNPAFPKEHLLCQDFFQLDGSFDLVLEQTFFCALEPALRTAYAEKMASLIKPGGWLAGVWFDFPLTEKGPPFGGSAEEYRETLSPGFEIVNLERSKVSEPSREGKEVLGWMKRKG